MTVKSLRKQLAAAIAMTLVATVALGSSTYAWFTMNKEVNKTYVAPAVRCSRYVISENICTGASVNLPQIDWKDEEEL